MSTIDYSLLQREEVNPGDVSGLRFDYFVSSFNSSERVKFVFQNVTSADKIWLRHPEYGYDDSDLDATKKWFNGIAGESEVDFWGRFLSVGLVGANPQSSIAFDITGMMRSHIMMLPLFLANAGYVDVTFLYSDPKTDYAGTDTKFTVGAVDHVGQVPGFEGVHSTGSRVSEVLIIGAGYDENLVRAVADYKRSADHYVMLGLPSLRPHMYQESQVRVHNARESIHNYRSRSFLYAPANNPFMTAQVLSDHVRKLRDNDPACNVYLSPVGAKTQVLGFAWFFLCECRDEATSVIFPYAPAYARETSRGVSSVHTYRMELDWIQNI